MYFYTCKSGFWKFNPAAVACISDLKQPLNTYLDRQPWSSFRVVLVLTFALFMSIACGNEKTQSPTQIIDSSDTSDSNASEEGEIAESGETTESGGTTQGGGTGEGGNAIGADNLSDLFDGNGPLIGYTTNNAPALPAVARKDSRYHATLLNNDNNITLHFNADQGRLDAKRVAFPFEFIARNIGIGTLADSQVAPQPEDFPSSSSLFMFAGIQIHDLDLEKRDSAHFVVGHRGSKSFTIEGKNTVNGSSAVNDAGEGIVPTGRADLRVVGDADKTLTWYWQQPNIDPASQTDDWIAYRGNGNFPGQQTDFGDEVYVGLITYAWKASSVPFVGTCDAIELIGNTP